MAVADCETHLTSSQCSEIKIKVASTRREREATFELAYRSYLRAGLCAPNELGIRITPYQLLPSTDIIFAELRGEIISTLSLVRDGELGLPLEAIYKDEVQARRRAGCRLAEVSCLADRRQEPARFFGLFCELARVMVQMAVYEGLDQLLIAVHPRHARMYQRAMAFESFGINRSYPAVNGNPAVALGLPLRTARHMEVEKWRRFVGDPLPASIIQQKPINAVDQRYFQKLLQQSSAPACNAREAFALCSVYAASAS
jgi:hypothetical protein